MSQFSNFVWDNGDKNGDSDGDVTDENFALKLKEGIVNMYTKGIGNLKRVVMSKICSQKHPLALGTQNICKSGTSKKPLFWHISSILAMKGSQLWPLTHLKDKYYGKTELGKKNCEVWDTGDWDMTF